MAKMVDIEKLKPLLKGAISEENETTFLEGLMGITVDYDESAVEGRIAEATKTARAEAQAEYSKKLHDMFFNGADSSNNDDTVDDTNTDPEIAHDSKPEVADIFTTEE
ncbi:MAG: hypothetical protein J6S07_05430 [Bacteroidaceae bacterium]|nr:hypothetical protein [Bacteroidaceae bacterium]